MNFFERLSRGIKKIKTKLIIYAILVVIVIIALVAPLAVAVVDGEIEAGVKFVQDPFNGAFWSKTISSFSTGILSPHIQFGKCFEADYFGTFFNMVKVSLAIFAFFAIIGIVKAIPGHEYEDIENGSSDWCDGGEQYKVLSRNKGIVLAEKNYLPVDKRGNVNVLVVRRFWSW